MRHAQRRTALAALRWSIPWSPSSSSTALTTPASGQCSLRQARRAPFQFPADTGAPPPDWAACYPGNGKLTPASYAKCNATQMAIIQGVRDAPAAAAAPALDHGTPHGACVDACPNQHCQAQGGPWCTSTTSPWRRQRRAGILTAPWRSTWTCAFPEIRRAGTVSSEGAKPICNNCANSGLG
jgi:hypothetical protein